MKFLLAFGLLASSPALAASVTCELASYQIGEAELTNCSDGSNIILSGTNNSPCRAETALDALLRGVQAGRPVLVNYQFFNHPGDRALSAFEVTSAAVAKNRSISTRRSCSSTHILLIRTK